MKDYHPLVKRLLDGELTLVDLPAELRAEGEEALRLLAAVDRTPVRLPESLDARVMAEVRRRAAARGAWRRWLVEPRDVELRLRVRPWTVGALAAAALLAVVLLGGPRRPLLAPAAHGGALVRFVLYAPGAKRVAIAGTFNQWDRDATPLAPAGATGVWTTTLSLPPGEHQYAFVVDGRRWVSDPAAPGVDDGFGRRNSVVAVPPSGGRAL